MTEAEDAGSTGKRKNLGNFNWPFHFGLAAHFAAGGSIRDIHFATTRRLARGTESTA
jgi:hypothetical protein